MVMSIEFLAEIIELRRLRGNIIEMSLKVEKPVKEIDSGEDIEEAEAVSYTHLTLPTN